MAVGITVGSGGANAGIGRRPKLSAEAQKLLEGAVEPCLKYLIAQVVGTFEDGKECFAGPRERGAAAQYLLDRHLGKPSQSVEVDGTIEHIARMSDGELEREIAAAQGGEVKALPGEVVFDGVLGASP